MKLKATLIILLLMILASLASAQQPVQTDCKTELKKLEQTILRAKELIKPETVVGNISYTRGMIFIGNENVLGKKGEIHYSEIIKLKADPSYIRILENKYYNLKKDKLPPCANLSSFRY